MNAATVDCVGGIFDSRRTTEKHSCDSGGVSVNPIQELDSGTIWQLKIGQHDVKRPACQNLTGLLDGAGGLNVKFLAELPDEQRQDRRFIVNYEHGTAVTGGIQEGMGVNRGLLDRLIADYWIQVEPPCRSSGVRDQVVSGITTTTTVIVEV